MFVMKAGGPDWICFSVVTRAELGVLATNEMNTFVDHLT
jgi:hypothetical protein